MGLRRRVRETVKGDTPAVQSKRRTLMGPQWAMLVTQDPAANTSQQVFKFGQTK
jgi:hypothetical protein